MEEFDPEDVMLRFRSAIEKALRVATVDQPGDAGVFAEALQPVLALYFRYAHENAGVREIYVLDGDVCFDQRASPWYEEPELRMRWLAGAWRCFELDDDGSYVPLADDLVDVLMSYAVPARVMEAQIKAAN